MCRGPEPCHHVDGVSRGQLELDGVDLEGHGDGLEEGVLHLLPELKDSGKDVIPASISGQRPVLGLLGTPERM
jgi:hypothetical protein